MNPIERFVFEFNIRHDYFECHEILEEVWQEGQRQDEALVGLIQLAVARYHHRRGNTTGAQRTYAKAFDKIERHRATLIASGIDVSYLLDHRDHFTDKVYRHIPLPVFPDVIRTVALEATAPNLDYVTHKHRLRDRTDVVTARQEALQNRRDRSI